MPAMPALVPERPERVVFGEAMPMFSEGPRIGVERCALRGRQRVRSSVRMCRGRQRMFHRRGTMAVLHVLMHIVGDRMVRNAVVRNRMVRDPMVCNPMVREPMVCEPMVCEPMVRKAMVHVASGLMAKVRRMTGKVRRKMAVRDVRREMWARMGSKMRCPMIGEVRSGKVGSGDVRRGEMRCSTAEMRRSAAEMRRSAAKMRCPAAKMRCPAAGMWRSTTDVRCSAAWMSAARASRLGGESGAGSRQHQTDDACTRGHFQDRGYSPRIGFRDELFADLSHRIVLSGVTANAKLVQRVPPPPQL